MRSALFLATLLAGGCSPGGSDKSEDTESSGFTDNDQDGYTEDQGDCDDTDASAFPGGTESCDGVDNDCNGLVDDYAEDATNWYGDFDGDGYGNPAYVEHTCQQPPMTSEVAGDCDDSTADVYPGADEYCNERDDDCDGEVDEATDVLDDATWYLDADGDGYGNEDYTLKQCEQPEGYVLVTGDCDDTRYDVAPLATEVCDSVDNDCDTLIDDEDPDMDPENQATWTLDADGDGFGCICEDEDLDGDCDDASCATTLSCDEPSGHARTADDCDDANAEVHPDATEVCDALDTDEDCDGGADDNDNEGAENRETLYYDMDGDGYGDTGATAIEWCDPPAYTSPTNNDCDDSEASTYPSATEVCDEIDNDCDGAIDENVVATWYADTDVDGYGDASVSLEECNPGTGWVSDFTDCDDTDASANPGATEICDEIDNNCDGDTDENVTTTWYADADGDSYGNPDSTTEACSPPSNYVSDNTDCDDLRSDANPGGTEDCSTSYDDDCDGDTNDDGASGCTTYYWDADADGYGESTSACYCQDTSAYTASTSGDCDDTDSAVSPGEIETCSTSYDDDCDGDDNDSDASGCTTWYYDYDGDGYGIASNSICVCTSYGLYTASVGQDCDDTDSSLNPGTNACGLYGDIDTSNAAGTLSINSYGLSHENSDLDGDGYIDILLSDYDDNGYTGTAWVMWGPITGNIDYASSGDTEFQGSNFNDQTGLVMGSVDGWGSSGGGTAFFSSDDDIYLLDGESLYSSGTYDLADTSFAVLSGADVNSSEDRIIDLGDVDGDGVDDVGFHDQDEYVLAFFGPITGDLTHEDYDFRYEFDSSHNYQIYEGTTHYAGDANGDGYVDLSSPYYYAAITLAYGPFTAGTYTDYDVRLYDGWTDKQPTLGDYDGDGLLDATQSYNSNSDTLYQQGQVFLHIGPLSGTYTGASYDYVISGSTTSENFGYYTYNAGDINGDGADELVSKPSGNSNHNYLFYGPITGDDESANYDAWFNTGSINNPYYYGFYPLGDLNNDGYGDFMSGAYWFFGEAL